ncbi:YdgH/BhsA/McbA-like domain containing protein [Gilliamella sp. wkB112]|uniref:YdgH/BhsA/McbA-like domain containing protein n=1 Tax=Gilliamella sp. wkB112 TaxID=3120257 RepID=UPI00080E49BF|nr:YdgH/BhsA/McbA-like domain containing protein [Gilliamella apicola]OCG01302.1 hypothetical protein A9G12_01740 [Gilliamella apicola]
MKGLNRSSIALAVLLSLPVANLYAAEPLSAEDSSQLIPMKEIAVTGKYLQADNAAQDISRVAYEAGAKFYHIKAIENATTANSADCAIVYADIYAYNVPTAIKKEEITYNGIVAYERNKALYYLPFEIIKFKGNYNNTSEIINSASKLAADKKAYAFYVYSISPADVKNQSQNIDVALYKKDAPVREYIVKTSQQDQDAYEISSDAFKKMQPYQTISFHGTFNNTSEISTAARKQAIANGAHFYFVKEVSANSSGTAQTVYVNLYR